MPKDCREGSGLYRFADLIKKAVFKKKWPFAKFIVFLPYFLRQASAGNKIYFIALILTHKF